MWLMLSFFNISQHFARLILFLLAWLSLYFWAHITPHCHTFAFYDLIVGSTYGAPTCNAKYNTDIISCHNNSALILVNQLWKRT